MGEFDVGIVLSWWKTLENDRGGRAQLRRTHNLTEVVFVEAYHRLYEQMENVDREKLALVAGVCSHIKEYRPGKLAEQMSKGDDKAKVSGLRFRRLLAIKDKDELLYAMIRIIRLLGGSVDVAELARTVYWWNENTRKQLAYDYYSKAKAVKEGGKENE